MDWKTAGNYVLLVGLFVATVSMFNQVNGRLDTMQAEMNRCFDENNRRLDAIQAEANRRFDQLFEALRVFERRITRLEENADIGAE